jgi:non-heme chloroperoxidase
MFTKTTFSGANGMALVADVAGSKDPTLLFLHGGGQTRHAWDRAAEAMFMKGKRVINLDARGHGESAWAPDGDYALTSFADDVDAVMTAARVRRAAVVGASMGGLTGLVVAARAPELVEALVLVDVVPEVSRAGASRIRDFMMEHAASGFASLDDVADAVGAYVPGRARPATSDGLMKNVRMREDGRFYWHWDPAFLKRVRGLDAQALGDMARLVRCPTLLVRGGRSDVIDDDGVASLKSQIPHLEIANVADAAHMVAGDRNDRFIRVVEGFLDGLKVRA